MEQNTRGQDFLYSLGSFSAAILGNAISTHCIFYYVDVLKVPSHLISIAMFFYGIWNSINDPLFGYISDRTKTRWGRRKPYIIWFGLPLALAFAAFWAPPFPPGSYALFIWYFVMIFLYDTFYTIAILNWTALFPEMYPSLEERSRVSALRQVVAIPGLMLGIAIPPMLSKRIGWPWMGAIFALLGGVTLYLSVLGSRERPEFAQDQAPGAVSAIIQTLFNKSFLFYIIPCFLIQYTFTGLTSALPFYAKYVLKATEDQTTLLLAVIFVVAFPIIPLWGNYTARVGPKKAMRNAMIWWAIFLLPFLFINNYIHGIVTVAILAVGLAGAMILFDVLLADVIDEDELKTGVRREGMYFGSNALVIRLGITLNSVVMGIVFKLGGYDANLPVDAQPARAILGFRILCSIVPIVATLIGLWALSYYPLDGERLKDVKENLELLHRQKADMIRVK